MHDSWSQTKKLKASGFLALTTETLTIVGNRVGAWLLRRHLPGPRFGLRPQRPGETRIAALDRSQSRSAHAPYSRRGFPHQREAHSYQLRMREAEVSFARSTQRANQTRGPDGGPASSRFPGVGPPSSAQTAGREGGGRRARRGAAVSAPFRAANRRPDAGRAHGPWSLTVARGARPTLN